MAIKEPNITKFLQAGLISEMKYIAEKEMDDAINAAVEQAKKKVEEEMSERFKQLALEIVHQYHPELMEQSLNIVVTRKDK